MLGKITDFLETCLRKSARNAEKRLKSSMSVMEISAMTV